MSDMQDEKFVGKEGNQSGEVTEPVKKVVYASNGLKKNRKKKRLNKRGGFKKGRTIYENAEDVLDEEISEEEISEEESLPETEVPLENSEEEEETVLAEEGSLDGSAEDVENAAGEKE